MFGTVAKLKAKPGELDALLDLSEEAEHPPRAVAEYVYQMEEDPSTLYLVVVFEDEKSYRANAESPEQHERFMKMMQHLEAEPEWHDGHIIHRYEA
ncbi:MAG: putative quinol monooxygenase [Anaerolineales bacterium]